MSKNFNSESFDKVNDKSKLKANVVTIVNIKDEDLIDNPENGEDTDYTADLELSIQENGFIDPIDVTDFEMEDGKYMLVSGHRRKKAGEKLGMTMFPCIIRHFDSKEDMINCMLLSQSFRDSSKDPLLYVKRYQLHEKYLDESGFTGSKREEIARRLGMSVKHADRYKNITKMIQPVWDFIAEGNVSISAIQPLASRTPEEQEEILLTLKRLMGDEPLTRETVRDIVNSYKERKEKNTTFSVTSGILMNDEPSDREYEPKERNRNNEMRREFDPIAAEYDAMLEDEQMWKARQKEENEIEKMIQSIDNGEMDTPKKEKAEESELDKLYKKGNSLITELKRIKKFLDDPDEDYKVRGDDVQTLFDLMNELSSTLIIEMNNLTAYHEEELMGDFQKAKHDIKSLIDGLM